MKINYNEVFKSIIDNLDYLPTVLLHSCCAPCSSEVIKRLAENFKVTVFYYNPNIEPKEEYEKRKNEQLRFIELINKEVKNKVTFLDSDYDNDSFENIAKGLEDAPEGGQRCHNCYELRLKKTASKAKENNYDYFCTTLTVSPYKNSQVINLLGDKISKEYNIKYLFSDFKKENGYKNSIEYSKKYNLYRQDYCGCNYSKNFQNN